MNYDVITVADEVTKMTCLGWIPSCNLIADSSVTNLELNIGKHGLNDCFCVCYTWVQTRIVGGLTGWELDWISEKGLLFPHIHSHNMQFS